MPPAAPEPTTTASYTVSKSTSGLFVIGSCKSIDITIEVQLYEGLYRRVNTMIRREFLAVALGRATGTLLHGQPHQNFPSEPRKRLAVSSYPFRNFIVSRDKPGMTLEQFAASIPARFSITGIEPWSHHLQSTEPEYLSRVKRSFDAGGVNVVNIPVDIRANLCSGETSERGIAYTNFTKSIDAAELLGSPTIRVHLPPLPISASYVGCAAAGDPHEATKKLIAQSVQHLS